MRIGINGSSLIALGRPLPELVEHAARAESDGFSSWWSAQLTAPDALTLLAACGPATSGIELGTAVVPTWTRHPLMLAGQALTTQELVGNRLTLGIGLAHRGPVEATYDIPFDRPAANMAEYLAVLLPALTERRVDVTGEIWSGHVDSIDGLPGARPPSVLLAAMGPRMLRLAAERTDGVILWLSGPRTIEERIAPALAAARPGDAPPARIVASVPVCVTDDPDGVRGAIAAFLGGYNDLPSYRGVMDAEGATGPADVSLVGDEATVAAGIERFAAAGATDFTPVEFTLDDDAAARTRALLRDVAAAAVP